ncbi:nucleotidyltransferase domain-containing protein [Candidatus Pacearchaeota archaeon]|nr:nucleotidyltransferase domain-containing protein [Candidatus Pacearchaeota archaeon]
MISYSMDFTSFLIQNLNQKNIEKIKSIILFGSVARGESGRESDVDIFVDLISDNKPFEEQINKISEKFFDSIKFTKYWSLMGIKNEFQVISGKLNDWKLKNSMPGNSIILYQKYSPKLEKGSNRVVLSWDSNKNNSLRVMLNKTIFGYNYYGKRYKGLLEVYNGKKLGANVIIIPSEHLNLFIKEFHRFKISVKINIIFEYEK